MYQRVIIVPTVTHGTEMSPQRKVERLMSCEKKHPKLRRQERCLTIGSGMRKKVRSGRNHCRMGILKVITVVRE